MKFELKAQDPKSKARAGVVSTDHGDILTPIFMPVGTAGTVKAVHQREPQAGYQSTNHLGQYLSLVLETWFRYTIEGWWTAQVQWLGSSYPYR